MDSKVILPGIISLMVVLAVLVLLIYLNKKLKRGNSVNFNNSKYIKILDKCHIGLNNYICIIQIGERYFLVAVSNSSAHIQQELEAEDLVALKKTSTSSFKDFLTTKLNSLESKKDKKNKIC